MNPTFRDNLKAGNRAYKGAALYFAYSICWSVLGLVLIWVGFLAAKPFSFVQASKTEYLLGALEIGSGVIVMVLGNVASFLKASTAITPKEFRQRNQAEETLSVSHN